MNSGSEGNSVDPHPTEPIGMPCLPKNTVAAATALTDVCGPDSKTASLQPGTGPQHCGDVGPSETMVFQSSTAKSSSACFSSYSNSSGINSVMQTTDAQSLSASEKITCATLIEPQQKNREQKLVVEKGNSFPTAELPRIADVSTPHLATHTFDSYSFTQETTNIQISNCGKTETVSISVDQSMAASSAQQYREKDPPMSSQQNQLQKQPLPSHPSTQSSQEFSFENSQLASRLKPQLVSDFLSKELGSTPESKPDIDLILRKYGLETRRYNPPVSLSKYGGGDLFGKSSSYRPYSSCRTSSAVTDRGLFSLHDGGHYSSFAKDSHRQLDISQNNEALNKLLRSTDEAEKASTQPTSSQKIPAGANKVENVDDTTENGVDTSKNNDATELQTPHQDGDPIALTEKTGTHESSVDIAVTSGNEASALPLTPAGSYSALKGSPSMAAYQSIYGSMRTRVGGYSMTSHPSTMDVSPFEGTYLKHHLANTKYAPPTVPTTPIAEITPAGSSTDAIIPYKSSYGSIGSGLGTPHDTLGFSLQQERQRLRNIDNLITSGPARSSRPFSTPYMSIHYGALSQSSTSSSAAISRTGSNSINNWSGTTTPASYDSPNDIAMIRRAGSNVDTGQFNNNRINTDTFQFNKRHSPVLSHFSHGDRRAAKKASTSDMQKSASSKSAQKTRSTQKASANSRASGKNDRKVGEKKSTESCTLQCRPAGFSQQNTQMNNSHSAISNGFDFAKELNRMWCSSVLENESTKKSSARWDDEAECNGVTSGPSKSDASVLNKRNKTSATNVTKDATPSTSSNSTCAPRKRVTKYQPYRPLAVREADRKKQQEHKKQQQHQQEEEEAKAEEETDTSPSLSASMSLHTLQEVAFNLMQQQQQQRHQTATSTCGHGSQLPHSQTAPSTCYRGLQHQRPSQGSCKQGNTQRHLVASTGLASGLIQKRQHSVLRQCSSAQSSTSHQQEGKKRAKPGRVCAGGQGRSNQIARTVPEKAKVRPASVRSSQVTGIFTRVRHKYAWEY